MQYIKTLEPILNSIAHLILRISQPLDSLKDHVLLFFQPLPAILNEIKPLGICWKIQQIMEPRISEAKPNFLKVTSVTTNNWGKDFLLRNWLYPHSSQLQLPTMGQNRFIDYKFLFVFHLPTMQWGWWMKFTSYI